ncbi:MAG: divalent-cation tolerance protein CutA [Desulfobacteraceae bacterium]|nr:MAG: divalent-cation tolerance protein CutA [Desulfobacteraceae bacterium]
METFFIYVTTKDKAEARSIGRYLVQSRLAACVNIFEQMNSMYIWQDQFQDDQEAVLIAKTTQQRLPELIEAIKSRHSYDVPCIVSLPIQDGNPSFLQWIAGQVEEKT